MMGNRGIYHDGWTARARCTAAPFDLVARRPDFSADEWELYDTTTDWTQAHDLVRGAPEKLAELQQLLADRGRPPQRAARWTTGPPSG